MGNRMPFIKKRLLIKYEMSCTTDPKKQAYPCIFLFFLMSFPSRLNDKIYIHFFLFLFLSLPSVFFYVEFWSSHFYLSIGVLWFLMMLCMNTFQLAFICKT